MEVNNQRNYLDFVLQAGSQVVAQEIGDDTSNDLSLSLDPFLREMSIDHQPVLVAFGWIFLPLNLSLISFVCSAS